MAEALEYQRREEVALLALLNGKADTEAEAWANLQKISLTSPWAGERSLEDIENTWHKWESKDKQVRLDRGPGVEGGRRDRGFDGPTALSPEPSLPPMTLAGEQNPGRLVQAQGAVAESRTPVHQRAAWPDEVPGAAGWALPAGLGLEAPPVPAGASSGVPGTWVLRWGSE